MKHIKSVIWQVQILLMVVLSISFGNHSHADLIKLGWDPPRDYASNILIGYKIIWGKELGNYTFHKDVGNVLEYTIDIPKDSFIAVQTIYSDAISIPSNYVIYGTDLSIQPASGGSVDVEHSVNKFEGTLQATILIRETAVYYIWFRVLSPSTGNNSFYIAIDNQNEQILHTPVFLEWEWFKYKEISFNEGNHSIVIGVREQRTQLDKICVTSDPEFMPIGKGEETGTDSNYWVEAEEMEVNYPFELGYDENASNGAFVWSLQSIIK